MRLISILFTALVCAQSFASVSVSVNGTSYTIPQTNEKGWGTNVTSWIQAMSLYTLQPSGGTFTLTAEVDTGATYGFKVPYIKTQTSTPATAGVLRLAKSDVIDWRNNGGGGNNVLGVDSSDNLTWNSVIIPSATSASVQDSTFSVYDNADNTKLFKFEASGITTGTTRTYTMPNATTNLVGAASTLTNHGVLLGQGAAATAATSTGSAGQLLTSGGASADPGWTTPTYPTTSGTSGKILVSDGTNNVYSTPTFPNSSAATGKIIVSDGTNWIASTPTYPNSSATSGKILRSDGTNFAASTATFPDTATAGSVLNASGSNVWASTVTPTIGVAGASTGTLSLAGVTSGTVTIQPQSAAGTYNFNLPTTAGNSGQVLTSAAGGSSPMTWSSPFTNPMSATGDLVYSSDGSGTPARLAAGTAGQVLTSAGAAAPVWATSPAPAYNFLINGGFDLWQVGTSATVTAAGGGTPSNVYLYQADQWYVRNVLGGGTIEGVITYSQVAAVTNGSGFGAKVQITTAPTGTGIQNGAELWQTLSNKASLPLLGQTASFTVLVKCFGNVNQMGAQFFYSTTEIKATVANTIGSEQTVTCNTATFVSLTIPGQALGTSATASGVIGVRIRPTAVSSGNLYDLNNGYVVEQAMLNLGTTAASFARQFADPAKELDAAQYFYQKSYALTVAPGTNTGNDTVGSSQFRMSGFSSGSLTSGWTTFLHTMRAAPTMTFYSTDGTSAKCRDRTNAANVTPTGAATGTNYFTVNATTSVASTQAFFECEWAADARL